METLLQFFNEEEATMKPNDYNISSVAEKEWFDFALYTILNRAIPNMFDGLKPSQRFYLYSSIKNSKKDFEKVTSVAGVMARYGYAHGDASGTGQLMAAPWNNNICLVQGRGNFGTRLVQQAAAARYTYSKLHENFDKYVKDIDLSPEHEDPEHAPPAFYAPTIPLVLANGARGVATAFATLILPRDVNRLKKACIEYVETGKINNRIPVKFPEFKGKTTFNKANGNFTCFGVFFKEGKTKLTITEVPYGYDRETYIKVLDKLEEDGDIFSYDDLCDKNGFKFEVKLKQNTSAKWSDERIFSKFKLTKSFTENMNVIGENENLVNYTDERDLIKDFCNFKMGVMDKRIIKKLAEIDLLIPWLEAKMRFIQAILDDKIVFKNRKKATVINDIKKLIGVDEDMADRLLRINIMSLTADVIAEAKKELAATKKERSYWKSTNSKEQFLGDLNEL